MGIKPGYKQTDAGIIPEDWDFCTVDNVAYVTTGGKNTQDRIENGEFPFFVRSSTVERIGCYSFDGESVLTAGDGVGTGKVFHYINGKFEVHQRVYCITNFKNNIDGYYFYLYFSNYFYARIMKMTAKSSVDSVRKEMIAKMPIALPSSIEEQRSIAEALRDTEALLDALERLIAKKHDIKQAAMQQLLTEKIRLPGFTGKWEQKTLGDVGVFLKGSGIKKDETMTGSLPCVRYGEIYTRHNDYIKQFHSWISPSVAETSTLIKRGDLLFAGSGETKEDIGKCAAFTFEKEAYAGGDIIILRTIGVSPLFMGFYCNSSAIVSQKSSMGQGDAIVHIHARSLAPIRISLPPLDEQIAISNILYDMDMEITTLESRLEKTRALKQAMMQELLTGKTRLVKPEARHAGKTAS